MSGIPAQMDQPEIDPEDLQGRDQPEPGEPARLEPEPGADEKDPEPDPGDAAPLDGEGPEPAGQSGGESEPGTGEPVQEPDQSDAAGGDDALPGGLEADEGPKPDEVGAPEPENNEAPVDEDDPEDPEADDPPEIDEPVVPEPEPGPEEPTEESDQEDEVPPEGAVPGPEDSFVDDPELVSRQEALNRLSYGSATVDDIVRIRQLLKNGEITISIDERSLVILNAQKEETHYHFRKNMACTYLIAAVSQMYGLLTRDDRGQNYLRAVKIGRIALTRLLDDRAFKENLAKFTELKNAKAREALKLLADPAYFSETFLPLDTTLLVLAGIDPELVQKIFHEASVNSTELTNSLTGRWGLIGKVRKLRRITLNMEERLGKRRLTQGRDVYMERKLLQIVYGISGIAILGINAKLGPVFLGEAGSVVSGAVGTAFLSGVEGNINRETPPQDNGGSSVPPTGPDRAAEGTRSRPKRKEPVWVRGEGWVNTAEYRWEHPGDRSRFRDESVAGLVKSLEEAPRTETRVEAIGKLAGLGEPALVSIGPLVLASADRSPVVRKAALRALDSLDPDWLKNSEAHQAIPALIERLNHNPDDVIRAIVGLLDRIGPAGVPYLNEFLLEGEDLITQVKVLQVLRRMGPLAVVSVPGVLNAFESRHTQVRVWAAKALAEIGPTREAVPLLLAGLSHQFPNVRESVAECLAAGEGLAEPSLPYLIPLLADRQDSVRKAAAMALEAIGPGVVPVMVRLVETRVIHEFKAWLNANQQVPDWFKDVIRAEMAQDPEKTRRVLSWSVMDKLGNQTYLELAQETAFWTLAKLGPAAATGIGVMVTGIEHANPGVRAAAVQALGVVGPSDPDHPGVISGLIRTLVDPDEMVREAASKAMKAFDPDRLSGPDGLAAMRALSSRLDEPGDLVVRAFVTIGPPAVPVLVEVLMAGEVSAQANAARALGGIGPDALEAVPALEDAALNDSHTLVQRETRRALRRIRGEETEE